MTAAFCLVLPAALFPAAAPSFPTAEVAASFPAAAPSIPTADVAASFPAQLLNLQPLLTA